MNRVWVCYTILIITRNLQNPILNPKHYLNPEEPKAPTLAFRLPELGESTSPQAAQLSSASSSSSGSGSGSGAGAGAGAGAGCGGGGSGRSGSGSGSGSSGSSDSVVVAVVVVVGAVVVVSGYCEERKYTLNPKPNS